MIYQKLNKVYFKICNYFKADHTLNFLFFIGQSSCDFWSVKIAKGFQVI